MFATLIALGMMVGTTVAGFLGETIGILPMLVLQGTGYVLGGLVVGLSIRRTRREPLSALSEDGSLG